MFERFAKRPFLAVFLFALLTHAALFGFLYARGFQSHEMTDGGQYMLLAQNMLDGHGFSEHTEAPYVPDAIRTPIYPLFLAAFKAVTGSFDPSLFVGVLLGATVPLCGMVLLMLLGRKNPKEWVIVGLLLSIDPHLFYYSLVFGSEAIFLPLVAWAFVAGAVVVNRPSVRLGLVAGVLFGLAVLARPIVQLFPLVLAMFLLILWRKDVQYRIPSRKTAAVLLLGYAIVVAPWIIRNVRVFGVTDFTNVGWFNMYTRVAATTEAIETHRPYDALRIEYLQRLHDKGYIDKSPVTELDVHGYEWKKIFQRETWETIKRYPRSFVVSQVSSFFTVISQDLTSLYLRKMDLIRYPYPSFAPFVKLSQEGIVATIVALWNILSWPIVVSIVGRVVWLIVFALSLWSLVVAWKRHRAFFPLVLLFVLYDLQIIALSLNAAAQSDARYRAQFIFIELPLAMFTAIDLIRSRMRRNVAVSPSCRICGAQSDVSPWGMKRAYHLYRCKVCHSHFVHPLPTAEELKTFYSDAYFFGGGSHGGYVDYDADKRAARESLISFSQLLERQIPLRGTLLDVGAATGAFLEVAKERGWNVSGHEVSEDAARRAREKGIPMTTGELASAGYASNSFDAVTLLDVIEHVPSPSHTMSEVVQLMKAGGVVLLNTPDCGSWYARIMGRRWHAYNPPEHLTIFDRRSLALLVERAGCEVVWSGKVKKSFRVSYILHTLSHWTRRRFFSRLAAVIERKKTWNWAIPLNLRDNIVLIARKRG